MSAPAPAAPGVRMLWFDFGGVLSPPLAELFASYERKTGIDRETLWAGMTAAAEPFGLPVLAPIELGLVTEPEWGRAIAGAIRRARPDLDLSRADLERFGAQWFAGERATAPVRDLLLRARAHGFRVGVLTNNVTEWDPHWRAVADVDDVVEAVIDSSRVGVRKPDPEIFALAAEHAGLPPQANLLVDDLAENVAAARASGWHAVRHEDPAATARELERLVGLPTRAPAGTGAAR
ncbi:HAD family phosphatase [Patulibacter sp. SYSU D01012]|uniref:HAD family hydrolase n=1 Tax=Patulibacter sp. SYSU D01012 TaxID=2817381 RepID=UPI001B30FBB2|nr:HAD family phosphatase [Patulibacter sp. SYSU D01012]